MDKFMGIFVGFRGEGTSNDSGVYQNCILVISVSTRSGPLQLKPTLLVSATQ